MHCRVLGFLLSAATISTATDPSPPPPFAAGVVTTVLSSDVAQSNVLQTFVDATPAGCIERSGLYYKLECDPATGWMRAQVFSEDLCMAATWSSLEQVGANTIDHGSYPIASGEVYRPTGTTTLTSERPKNYGSHPMT